MFVFLFESSPFWEVFRERGVPVKCANGKAVMVMARLGEGTKRDGGLRGCFLVDVEALDEVTVARLAQRIAELFEEEIGLVLRDIRLRGLPLRVCEVAHGPVRSADVDRSWEVACG